MKRPCSGFRPIKQATSYLANEGDGTIVYRENKNVSDNLSELGYECNVKAGQKVHINFTTGKGKVE